MAVASLASATLHVDRLPAPDALPPQRTQSALCAPVDAAQVRGPVICTVHTAHEAAPRCRHRTPAGPHAEQKAPAENQPTGNRPSTCDVQPSLASTVASSCPDSTRPCASGNRHVQVWFRSMYVGSTMAELIIGSTARGQQHETSWVIARIQRNMLAAQFHAACHWLCRLAAGTPNVIASCPRCILVANDHHAHDMFLPPSPRIIRHFRHFPKQWQSLPGDFTLQRSRLFWTGGCSSRGQLLLGSCTTSAPSSG
ncbi:hypothetical protein T440DRAFT_82563 [Plenodomus tracheiphilus IPT5]|uniref:Uncharacterized protein n=1 Tax=Plenodomus tracheiphilus IPT5 TaxID=1408161 RepID=A0A6A7B5V1_9PLEO|nr:hypothetical protein T440DRAFT_82563 [Plenodomus tracheiphilus IPT5]